MFSANINITVSLDEQTRKLLADVAAAFGRGETVTNCHDFAAAEPVPVQEEQQPAIAVTEPEKEVPEKNPTLEDVRAAITAARVRIEGEDWQTATSEGRKLYHNKVTEKIKQLASLFDATKPSEIKAENRKQFIRELQDLGVDENGEIVQKWPF